MTKIFGSEHFNKDKDQKTTIVNGIGLNGKIVASDTPLSEMPIYSHCIICGQNVEVNGNYVFVVSVCKKCQDAVKYVRKKLEEGEWQKNRYNAS